MSSDPSIYVLLGPTASGKSSVALLLAKRLAAEILSVDSMQVYRGMNIGTAKPSADEQSEVKHHLIDLVDPNETFTVRQFVDHADRVIVDARTRNKPLVITGGTPLYYKALFDGIFEGPGTDVDLRERFSAESLEQLYARLVDCDPDSAKRIHPNDRRRVTRALEVHELTGRTITSFQTEWSQNQQRHAARWFGLQWDKDELNRRINSRTKQMFTDGWADETRAMIERFGEFSPTAGAATGYKELTDLLKGLISKEQALEQIKIATRQLARRQIKWFRRWPQVKWLEGQADASSLVDQIMAGSGWKEQV